jgi:hypothetical protein
MRQYNPEDSSEHHTRRRENFKSNKDEFICSLFNDDYSVDYIHDELERILKEVVVT